ncbi:MAG: hypothetical protein KF894_19435 [Labilithrix sp.]|nr:hypothetical protein [Labilithrix sp.]
MSLACSACSDTTEPTSERSIGEDAGGIASPDGGDEDAGACDKRPERPARDAGDAPTGRGGASGSDDGSLSEGETTIRIPCSLGCKSPTVCCELKGECYGRSSEASFCERPYCE